MGHFFQPVLLLLKNLELEGTWRTEFARGKYNLYEESHEFKKCEFGSRIT